jgi:hypothetical protein
LTRRPVAGFTRRPSTGGACAEADEEADGGLDEEVVDRRRAQRPSTGGSALVEESKEADDGLDEEAGGGLDEEAIDRRCARRG